MGNNSTSWALIEERINFVYELIIKGYSNYNVFQIFRDKYGLSEKTFYNYLKVVKARMIKSTEKNMENLRSIQVERYLELYKQFLAEGKKKEAKEVLARIDKINGLEESKLNVKGDIDYKVNIIVKKPKE